MMMMTMPWEYDAGRSQIERSQNHLSGPNLVEIPYHPSCVKSIRSMKVLQHTPYKLYKYANTSSIMT